MRELQALPRGTGLARYVKALVQSGGNLRTAISIAQQWNDTPAPRMTLEKALANPLGSGDGLLAEYGLSQAFIEIFRSESIVGRLSDRMIPTPFKVAVPQETTGPTVQWVEEANRKPVSAPVLGGIQLAAYKLAGILVISQQLARHSTPAAEGCIRRMLTGAASDFVDAEFLDADAPVADVSPGGICNGAAVNVSTGPAAAQIAADLSAMAALLTTWRAPHWTMRPRTLAHIWSVLPDYFRTIDGQVLMLGMPVQTSAAHPARLNLIDFGSILLADDGNVRIDLAEHATLTMDDNLSPATTGAVSLWQQDLVAIRIEREIAWDKAAAGSVVTMIVAY